MKLRVGSDRKIHRLKAGEAIDSMTLVREHEVCLLFDAKRDVISGKGIELSGKQSMTGMPGDLLCLICDGQMWHEKSRVVK